MEHKAGLYIIVFMLLALIKTGTQQELVFQKEGIALARKGLALHSTTDIYIALKTHLATEHILPSKSDCADWTQVRSHIQDMEDKFFEELEQVIPCHFKVINNSLSCKHESRVKRGFFGSLFGIGLAAIGIFDVMRNHKIASSIDSLKRHERELNDELFNLKAQMSQETKILKGVVLKVRNIFQGLHSEIISTYCKWITESRKVNSLINAYLARNQIKELLADIFTNKLSAEILNPIELHKIIKEHALLKTSAYGSDIGLFYTLAQTFLYKIDFQNRILDIVISVPLIESNAIANIYEIHNLGILIGNQYAKFSLPKLVYIGENEAMEVEETKCQFHFLLYICKRQSFRPSPQAKCLEELYFNRTSNVCQLNAVKTLDTHKYRYTENGLMLTTTKPFYITYRNKDGIMYTRQSQSTENSSRFIRYIDFDHILIENTILQTEIKINTEVKFLELKSHENFVAKVMNESVVNFNELIKEIDQVRINNKKLKLEDTSTYFSMVSLILLSALVTGIITFWNLYWRKLVKRIECLENSLGNSQQTIEGDE